MRKSHGEGGIISKTENPQTMATWLHSMDPIMTKSGDLKKMSGSGDDLQTVHKEESLGRNRQLLHSTLESCINPLDPPSHAAGCFSISPMLRQQDQAMDYGIWSQAVTDI